MQAEEDDAPVEITAQEEFQLRRVYELLCNYSERQVFVKEIAAREDRIAAVRNQSMNPVINDMGNLAEVARMEDEIRGFERQIDEINHRENQKIGPDDLHSALSRLGKKLSRKEIANMIWEVDESLDGCVDWDEFRLMFVRNISDKSGLEPASFYNLVQFMIFDQNDNGQVSVDETMNMLYERYGRQRMERKLRELFGDNMQETGTQGGEINFHQYLEAVERTQFQTFMASPQGKMLERPKKSKSKRG